MKFFQNQIYLFSDTLIRKRYFSIMKMNDFPVYLSDISAKTASLVHRQDMMSCTGEGNKVAAL